MKLATAAQMKELDQRTIQEDKIPSLDLMERAADAVAKAVLDCLPERPGKGRAAVLCGSGNNGGDGIAAGRKLFLAGVQTRVFLVGEYQKLTPDAMEETRRLSECGVELEAFDPEDPGQHGWVQEADVCVDALLGVGLSRDVAADSPFAVAMDWMNAGKGRVVAADVPSGVSAETGKILGKAVHADRTITFTLPKIGCFAGEGALYAGAVTVAEIGIPKERVRGVRCPVQTVEEDFVREALPPRAADGHKGTFGKLLIVGGAVGYTGAPCLSAAAAERTGCGLVSLGVPQVIWPVAAAKCSGAMPFPLPDTEGVLSESALQIIQEKLPQQQVLALGPGLGRSPQTEQLVCKLLESADCPVVLDADGINALAAHIDVLDARRGRITILTPHDGEFQRLVPGGLAEGGRVAAARDFAAAHHCILVLKGHRTLTATPEGNVLVNTTGCSALAKGGSGDVLTGVIASLLAQGASPVQAAAGGVWLHGWAGEAAAARLTEYGVTPEDVIASLPEVLKELLHPQEKA